MMCFTVLSNPVAERPLTVVRSFPLLSKLEMEKQVRPRFIPNGALNKFGINIKKK
jgi:hypothetical protein